MFFLFVFLIPDITLQWLIQHSKSRRSWKCRSCSPAVFAMLLSCHTPSTLPWCTVSNSHAALSCPVILSQPLRMYYKKSMIPIPDLRNAIGIIRPIKLFPLTWSKNLFSDLPFTIQALPIITPYPVVYNTNLGYTITQEGWFCQKGLI